MVCGPHDSQPESTLVSQPEVGSRHEAIAEQMTLNVRTTEDGLGLVATVVYAAAILIFAGAIFLAGAYSMALEVGIVAATAIVLILWLPPQA